MEIFRDETEITDIPLVPWVVDILERRSRIQRIVRLGLLDMEYDDRLDDSGEDDYDIDNWVHGPNNFRGYPGLSDMSSDRGFRGNRTRSPDSVYQSSLHHYASAGDLHNPASVKVKDTERRARLLQESKKSQEKAEKKRLKRQKRKLKRSEKLEKGKPNQIKDEAEKTDAQESKADDSKPVNDKSKDKTNSSVQQSPSAKDTDSSDSGSEDGSRDEDGDTKNDSCDSEGLDMTSTFVTKAALIAKRKAEQRPRPERKEKKKNPVKERKTVPYKPNEEPDVEKKDPAVPRVLTFEDNVKISTELAVIGNRFANSGDFNMAVKYFTDAIKYNPRELKLFGNRSFCFERMQEYEKALTDAELCLNVRPGWVKGLFRKGRALAGLKRYEESAQAFRDVLKLDGSYVEAHYELMQVQMTHLMEYGFTREQSSNALVIHGTVKKALEVLLKLRNQPGAIQNASLPPAQVVNVTGFSPVLSANTNPAPADSPYPPQSHDVLKTSIKDRPLGPVHNMSNVHNQPKAIANQAMKNSNEKSQPPLELFPVWVGNLIGLVTESEITNLFNKAGVVYSVKVLVNKRCAFVNFTKQEYCDEAIRRFHGFELNGLKIAVRYPDRIPPGMGISKSALKANDLLEENGRQYAVGSRRPLRPNRHDYRN